MPVWLLSRHADDSDLAISPASLAVAHICQSSSGSTSAEHQPLDARRASPAAKLILRCVRALHNSLKIVFVCHVFVRQGQPRSIHVPGPR
jgi:hypothetical protein